MKFRDAVKDKKEIQKIKNLVDKIGQKEVAGGIDMPYQTLNNKLNGYLSLSREQANKIIKFCSSVKN